MTVPADARGLVDVEALGELVDERGRRPDAHEPEHARAVRGATSRRSPPSSTASAALVYYDGANLNAILGSAVPATWASTSSTSTRTRRSRRRTAGEARAPGPSAWSSTSCRYLPAPIVERDDDGVPLGPTTGRVDRTHARVPRQRRGAGARLRLRLPARRRRARPRERARGAERELPRRAPRGRLPARVPGRRRPMHEFVVVREAA